MANILQPVSTSVQTVPISVFSDNPIVIAPEDYPNGQWSAEHAAMNRYWALWKGYTLEEKTKDKKALLYPMKLNMVAPTVVGHSSMVIGQVRDGRIVKFGISTSDGVPKNIAEETGNFMNQLWAVNNGDSIFLEMALFQQIFGGTYIKSAWTPNRKKFQLRFFGADPRAVFPVWDGDDYDRLVAVDIVHQIPKPAAQARYNVNIDHVSGNIDYATVTEHWDENEYWITIEGKVARWKDGTEMKGKNPYIDPVLGHAIIPIVYIPRVRCGSFWGDSIIPSIEGPQEEVNAAMAHLGDGLADAMHQQPWVKNRAKGKNGLHMNRNEWLDLGMTQLGTAEPEVGRLPGADITAPMVDLVTNQMIRVARQYIGMPGVAWGETDASIRSALTLAFMMKPMVDFGTHYRLNMYRGLKQMCYISAVMAYNKSRYLDNKISEGHIEAILTSHKTSLPTPLPLDRQEIVSEVAQRIATKTISRKQAIIKLDGVDGVEEQIAEIEADEKAAEEKAMKLAQQQSAINQPQPQKSGKPKTPKDTSVSAQAKGGRNKGNVGGEK